MSLSPEQRREYRAIAHNLKPVIIVGDKGLSEGLQEELERALNDHELIKIKVASQDRETRHEAITALGLLRLELLATRSPSPGALREKYAPRRSVREPLLRGGSQQ